MKKPIRIESDKKGYIGRECPVCEKYFKIKFGTGLRGVTDCYCPYCNHRDSQDKFGTKQQIEHLKSVAHNKATGVTLKDQKKSEDVTRSNQLISIGVTLKGQATPIVYYSEQDLEQKVICNQCALEYAIYEIFSYCPNCGIHNSKQIVFANYELILKILALSANAKDDIKAKLIENALEDVVSIFDEFGREHCLSTHTKISFQNISSAQAKILADFEVDISSGLTFNEWDFVVDQFQKKHLLTHKSGIIDDDFVRKTGKPASWVGKRISITEDDIRKLISYLLVIADNLFRIVPLG
ncbi:MAG: hypothetical protein JW976_13375 [Syntrophaceae bacterium]|nr:hypothetical protein [Syntrophaceae bacterium]